MNALAEIDQEIANIEAVSAALNAQCLEIRRAAETRVASAWLRRMPLRRRAGHVYFVTDGVEIKIGFSKGPLVRMGRIKKKRPGPPLKMIAHFPGFMDEEHNLHRFFDDLRVGANANDEWFRADSRITDLIAELERVRRYFWFRVIQINDVLLGQHTQRIEKWHGEGRVLMDFVPR